VDIVCTKRCGKEAVPSGDILREKSVPVVLLLEADRTNA
jgi:hypothetical protein